MRKKRIEIITKWHRRNTRPQKDRPGLYQVKISDLVGWCYWDGEHWGWAYPGKKEALIRRWTTSCETTQKRVWRGLVKIENP